jgi:myb proto-oncogene protein
VTDAVPVPSRTPKYDQTSGRAGRWTPEEDAKLIEAVTEFGKDWLVVAAKVPNRTNVQCRYRWIMYLDLDTKSGKWTAEEDAKLTVAEKELGNDWTAVAAIVPGRTNKQCCVRWAKSSDPDTKSGNWTVEEDAKLTVAVKEFGEDWGAVAAMVPGRTNAHCRRRWANSLAPDINSGKWTAEEDAKLTVAVTSHGNDWVRIAALVPGRTNIQCRDRWVTIKPLDPDRSTMPAMTKGASGYDRLLNLRKAFLHV